MISEKTLKALEYDQIMLSVAKRATLISAKKSIVDFKPVSLLAEACLLLQKTKEAYLLLYNYNVSGVYYFDEVNEQLERAQMGGTLNNLELLQVASNLKSARIAKNAIEGVHDDSIVFFKEIVSRLFINHDFEEEISSKIISEDEISDNASSKLCSIRKSIRSLNASIRERLNLYMRGKDSKFLQDGVVTMRGDRYVIPVKSEYRGAIKGFIHDQSLSGATVFIEPEIVMELNNELKHAMLEENAEIQKILSELSAKVASMADVIRYNAENLCEIDVFFARAVYSFENKCTYPELNDKGIITINRGRHPLINKDKVIPVSLSLGSNFNFLLVTGPNTGGKTVTMKLVGLLSLMAMSGLYIPADDQSQISVFENVFCDIGDEQSIANDLSTFSSHTKNLISIFEQVNHRSLVLIDEIGAGTDPEEGCALALAFIEYLIDKNCYGIITTHYSKLKEFAVENKKIENASMEFDAVTLRPLYKINIGIPGSSNAIEIAKTLGLDKGIINKALGYVSSEQITFENVLKKAEEDRRKSEKLSLELEKLKKEKSAELEIIATEREKITKEREKIYNSAKQETKRIVADKLVEAEEIIDELKEILERTGLESKETFRAGELRNRLKNSRYLSIDNDETSIELKRADKRLIKINNRVYVKSLGAYGVITKIKDLKQEVEVTIGTIKTLVKFNDLYNSQENAIDKRDNAVKVYRKVDILPKSELNVVGKTSLDAITELTDFIDQAVMNGMEEIKIIHGVGEGILLKEIRHYLKGDKNVLEYRRGKYGEGENGVTIIRLK